MAGRKQYRVLSPYRTANKKIWLNLGDEIVLDSCEAEFLRLSGKISPLSSKPKKLPAKGEKTNA